MKRIPLTPSGFTLVDDEEYEELSKYRWHNSGRYVSRGNYLGKVAEKQYKYTVVKMQRQILDAPQNMEVDHINGDRFDNRRCNLRLASRSQNMANLPQRQTRSGYKGVSYQSKSYALKGPWIARIGFNNKRLYIGNFETKEQAALAYNDRALELFGEFANLNKLEISNAP